MNDDLEGSDPWPLVSQGFVVPKSAPLSDEDRKVIAEMRERQRVFGYMLDGFCKLYRTLGWMRAKRAMAEAERFYGRMVELGRMLGIADVSLPNIGTC